MQKKTIVPLVALCGVPFIMVLGNSMLIPILPQMKEALDVSQFKVSLAITLFSVPAGLTIPIAGFLSDRINRKAIIVPSLILYALGGVVAGLGALFLKSYLVIMAGRILQGVGAAGTAPIAMALASDIFTSNERTKVLGLLESANGLGKVISPILGAAIGLIAWWAVFFLFPIICIPIALGIWFLVKEPAHKKQGKAVKEYLKAIKTIFKNKGVSLVSAFLAGTTVLFVLFGVLFYLSDYLETKYKIEGILKGLILAIPVLAMSTTSYLTGLFTQKRQGLLKMLVVAGLGILSASMVVIPFFQENTYVLVGALVFAGIGTGLVLPCLNTLITSSVNIDERGMITSLYGGVRFFGVAGGPPLFGLLMERSPLWTFLTPAILAGVSSLVVLFFMKQKLLKRPTAGQEEGQEAQKEKEGSEKSILLKARIRPLPDFRPQLTVRKKEGQEGEKSDDLKERIITKVLQDLKPRIDQSIEKHVHEELAHLKVEAQKEIKKAVAGAIIIEEGRANQGVEEQATQKKTGEEKT